MEVAVHTKYTNREFTSTLYEARTPAAVNNDSDLLTSIQETLAMENARRGILMARNHVKDTVNCRTQLGTWVPLGSPLSYQLVLTEGEFNVYCNVVHVRSGFWHICLDDESSQLTTFNTPFGRYRWKMIDESCEAYVERLELYF